jgi:glucokinase
MQDIIVGVDIGGSHLGVGFTYNGLLISSFEIMIDSSIIPGQVVDHIVKIIQQNRQRDWQIIGIGIACPGQCKNGVLVAASNFPFFYNVALTDLVSLQMNRLPVVLLNDANAAIAAEVWGETTKNLYAQYQNIAMIIIGTGIGCGLILNGKLYEGSNGLIEAGHMIISNDSNDRCGCGQVGCVEVYASAQNTALRLMAIDSNDCDNKSKSINAIGSKEVFDRYKEKDNNAINVLNKVFFI